MNRFKYPTYEDVKYFYDKGCYTDEEILIYYECEVITAEEFTKLTGKNANEFEPIYNI